MWFKFGYFVGVELRVALHLVDEHVTKWRPVVRKIQSKVPGLSDNKTIHGPARIRNRNFKTH
jgi:hypothetical protein